MKKTALTLIALIAFTGSAFAAAKDTYEYKGGTFGKVTFSHKTHQSLGCKKCHEGTPGKMTMTKALAHDKMCIVCHKAEKKGPVGCKDCHKK